MGWGMEGSKVKYTKLYENISEGNMAGRLKKLFCNVVSLSKINLYQKLLKLKMPTKPMIK